MLLLKEISLRVRVGLGQYPNGLSPGALIDLIASRGGEWGEQRGGKLPSSLSGWFFGFERIQN